MTNPDLLILKWIWSMIRPYVPILWLREKLRDGRTQLIAIFVVWLIASLLGWSLTF